MNIEVWNRYLSYTADFAEGIPLIPFLFLHRRGKQTYRLLSLYFLIGATLKITTFFLAKNGVNTLSFYYALALLEVTLLFLFFHAGEARIWIIFALVVLLIINLADDLNVYSEKNFNSISWSINTLVLMLSCLLCFYKLYNTSYQSWDEVRPMFLILSGFLLYFGGCMFTYILGWRILSEEIRNCTRKRLDLQFNVQSC